jgi:uncharacterized coiled-coil DUF342 family protein
MLDVKDTLLVFGIISSIVISILAARGQFKRIPSQNDSDDANAVRSYAEAAERISNENREMANEVYRLRDQMNDLRKKLEEQITLIQQLKMERDELKNWAERLVHQLKSHELEPVPFYREAKEISK